MSRIHPELLQKLLGSHSDKVDDKRRLPAPPNNNFALDVALSLNKQCRWLLPKALIRQVSSNDIALSDLTVSVLERHKLKRPANCVSFHSNRGEIRRIQPRNGRYFSFAYPTLDGKSRRAARREQREEMRELLKRQEPNLGGRNVEIVPKPLNDDPNLELGESEIRYEVFYPSPAYSSISHNPKYIKQDVTFGPGDDVNSEYVQHGKPRKQHRGKQRKRMTLRDVDDCDLPAYSDAVYYDHGSMSTKETTMKTTTTMKTYDAQQTAFANDEDEEARRRHTTQSLLSSLIEKAEQFDSFAAGKSRRRRKKSGSKDKRDNDAMKQDCVKSRGHIIYLSDLEEQQKDSLEKEGKKSTEDEEEDIVHVPCMQKSPISGEVSRVILPREDVTPDSLKDCFGQRSYIEAACRPRKFLLDVTSSVRTLLKKKGGSANAAEDTGDAVSFLIFIHDGFYDEEHDVYKVVLNSRLQKRLCAVKLTRNTEQGAQEGLTKGTVMNVISKTIDFVDTLVEDLMTKKHFSNAFALTGGLKKKASMEQKLPAESILSLIHAEQRVLGSGSGAADIHIPTLEELLAEEPAFCDLCYADVSPLTQDSAEATSLLKCRHRVCDACWYKRLQKMVSNETASRLTCPAHDCLESVDIDVLLTLIGVDAAGLLLLREEKVRGGDSLTEKICPDKSCGRVIRLPAATAPFSESDSAPGDAVQQDVLCACGAHLCFNCLAAVHWPATCSQAAEYITTLDTPGSLPDRASELHVDKEQGVAEEESKMLILNGKKCPSCHQFLTTEGGNVQVTCVCGHQFCWICTKAISNHHPKTGFDECLAIKSWYSQNATVTIAFRHADTVDNKMKKKDKPSTPQKVSLVERAAEQRQLRLFSKNYSRAISSLTTALTAAAAKDSSVAQHIRTVCGRSEVPSSSSLYSQNAPKRPGCTNTSTAQARNSSSKHLSLTANVAALHPQAKVSLPAAQSTGHSVQPAVTSFLKTAVRCKHDLHEVAEYTLVLLRDIPDSVLRRRALRISEDLEAFCSFMQSILDVWGPAASGASAMRSQQDALRALTRLAEIQSWARATMAAHVVTVKKIRSSYVTSGS